MLLLTPDDYAATDACSRERNDQNVVQFCARFSTRPDKSKSIGAFVPYATTCR